MISTKKLFLSPEAVARLSSLELRARLVVEGFIAGLHQSPYHGFSVEFAEHREYIPGDEIRRLDWRVLGRTERYYVKEYLEETNLKTYIALDTSASMGFRSAGAVMSKLEYATLLAAALTMLLVEQRDAVGLATYDEKLHTLMPPRLTRAYAQQIIKTLAGARPAGKTASAVALARVAERITRRGLVIVISDFLDDLPTTVNALKRFRHAGCEVILFHVMDPVERTLELGNNVRLHDLETGEELLTQPQQLKESYQKKVHEFTEQLKRSAREMEMDYVLMDTRTPFDVALAEYLRKRKRLN